MVPEKTGTGLGGVILLLEAFKNLYSWASVSRLSSVREGSEQKLGLISKYSIWLVISTNRRRIRQDVGIVIFSNIGLVLVLIWYKIIAI